MRLCEKRYYERHRVEILAKQKKNRDTRREEIEARKRADRLSMPWFFDTHELAWAAGFFDGEGNIRAKPVKTGGRVYYYPTMFIPQIDPQVLDRFQHAVGLGKVSGPYDRSRDVPPRQDQWHYEVFSFERVQAVVAMLWRWLSPVKKEQARATLMTIKESRKPTSVVFQDIRVTDETSGITRAVGECP